MIAPTESCNVQSLAPLVRRCAAIPRRHHAGTVIVVSSDALKRGATMNREEDLLQQVIRIASIGRDFFVEMKTRISDSEVRAAFEYISDVKSRFVLDLAPWVPAGKLDDQHHVSAAASAARIYVDLKRSFDGTRPQLSAGLLDIGEQQLIRLVERVFETAKSPVLRKLLKAHYPSLIICREAMSRLSARRVA
jgi:uncharacterized protein (TIGR02284 family)